MELFVIQDFQEMEGWHTQSMCVCVWGRGMVVQGKGHHIFLNIVTTWKWLYLSVVCCCSWDRIILRLIRIQWLVYPLTLSFIPNMILLKRFPHTCITLNNSLGNTITPSQRLVTTSVSLRTQTGLRCLIIQVLNIKSLLPNCLIQSFHFCSQ